MNKQDAARFLNVSEKTLERLVNDKHELSVRYERTNKGRVAIFDDDELTKYKETRQAGVLFPAMVKAEPQSLVTPLIGTDGQANLLAALVSFADAQNLSAISHKLTLTLDEAVQLSGLSKATLRAAISEGKLRTFQGQRGSKNIRRADLDNFISSL